MLRVGAWYDAYVWRREPNSPEYQKTNIHFKAQIVSTRDSSVKQVLQGLMSSDDNLIVRAFVQDISEKDQVLLLGAKHFVQSVSIDYRYLNAMGGGRFNQKHLEEKLPKIIVLK